MSAHVQKKRKLENGRSLELATAEPFQIHGVCPIPIETLRTQAQETCDEADIAADLKRLKPEDYTVGWICALSTESVAAQAFLDDKHAGPEYVSTNDNNDYTLGRVGQHNVVIAVGPDGEYGTQSAATVARDMMHSFPNVRIGLMVGIGGGVPSQNHDIRLGDIVVSAPRDGKGGVFQYDFGKEAHHNFQPTGFLNQPPTLLRTAVTGLRAQYEYEGHRIKQAVNTALERNPRLRKNYQRPAPNSDRLYRSEVTHPLDDSRDCAEACSQRSSDFAFREPRAEDTDDPMIHYGLIASGNRVMKDAFTRDKAAIQGVLCFEMEAAGLMNHFPCLIIRGICDYSDSHKSKQWQGYAAMVAAAYAKDLLCRILPNRLQAEKSIMEALSGIQESVQEVIYRHIDRERIDILKWLSPFENDDQQSDYLARRQAGTGQWLLESAEFQNWLDNDRQTLFCPGIPGAGKTILTSVVINDLYTRFRNDTNIGIAFLYCNWQRQAEQRPEYLVASLLTQFAQNRPSLPKEFENLFQNHRTSHTRPSLSELTHVMQSIGPDYSRMYVLIDALDECEGSRQRPFTLLSTLFTLQAHLPVNIFVTSRPDPEINKYFTGCPTRHIRAHDDDLLCYINAYMPRLLKPHISGYQNLQRTIREYVMEAADGMFLLVKLHMDSLMSQPTVGHLKLAIRNLPQGINGLNKTYDQAMARINSQDAGYRELAKQVLSWVTYARRVLSTVEIQHALAVRSGMMDVDEDFLPEVHLLGSICAGLVTVDNSSNIVHLVHYTTQEYLKRTLTDAEKDIAATCLSYLSFDAFNTGPCSTNEEFDKRLLRYPLYDYAAKNWGYHVCAASLETEQMTLEFLENSARINSCSQALRAIKLLPHWPWYIKDGQGVTALHLTAYFGLKEPTIALIQWGHEPDAKDSSLRTPLSWAAELGQDEMVQFLLLQGGVDPDSRDIWDNTPLLLAAAYGHEAVVKLLVAKNAVDINFRDRLYQRTPLFSAAWRGHEAVVKVLLDMDKIDADPHDKYGRTPLSFAAEIGHEGVVKLLLASGRVTIDVADSGGRTPLSLATQNGHSAVVKLLKMSKERM